MLSVEENRLLTQVGPGTAMGDLLRHYWLPAMLSTELPESDCPPVRLRLLGEDLVAFRASSGRIGVLDTYCPHRNANLFWGRNEEEGLRCVYHGWKFDADGACVGMPNEPPASRFMEKVHTIAYAAEERAGVIWVYMGDAERRPQIPDLAWMHAGAGQRYATKRVQLCSYLQNLEGECDSSHIAFLHRNNLERTSAADQHPVFDIQDTGFGLAICARRDAPENAYYWRITPFLMPLYTIIPGLSTFTAAVPMDDSTMIGITVTWNEQRPLGPSDLAFLNNGPHAEVDARFRPLRNIDNDYLIDRRVQRTSSFTGIEGVRVQDMAVQEDQRGPIANRARERLGTSDQGIIALRRRLLEQVRALQQGIEPGEPHDPGAYAVHAIAATAPRHLPWAQVASENGMPLEPAEAPALSQPAG